MKGILKQLYTSPRIFWGVAVGVTAALAQADLIADWITLVVIAAATPFDDLRKSGSDDA